MVRNYQNELEKIIEKNKAAGRIPSLCLHSCCAPCSSYVLEYLSAYFKITVFYYNPNIYPEKEYWKRVSEQRELLEQLPAKYPISFMEGIYEKERFYKVTMGMEHLPEGRERCFACYKLRLQEAAKWSAQEGFDYFTTSLSISPLKNAEKLNEIGESLAKEYRMVYLPSDFKKKNGYQRSIELSKTFGLYRQDYCGCIFSKQEREAYQAKTCIKAQNVLD